MNVVEAMSRHVDFPEARQIDRLESSYKSIGDVRFKNRMKSASAMV